MPSLQSMGRKEDILTSVASPARSATVLLVFEMPIEVESSILHIRGQEAREADFL